MPLARRSAGMRTHAVADGASVRQQRRGGSTQSRVLPHPGMPWAPLHKAEVLPCSQASLLAAVGLWEGHGATLTMKMALPLLRAGWG